MKNLTLVTLLAALLTLNSIAQTGPEQVTISVSGNLIGQSASMTMEFSSQGSNQFDVADSSTLALPLNHVIISEDSLLPLLLTSISLWTLSSDSVSIDHFDARPEFDRTTSFLFGIKSPFTDTLTITANTSWINDPSDTSSNSAISYVYLEEISTGNYYQLLNQNVSIVVSDSMLMPMNYRLHIVAQPLVFGVNPLCFGGNNGSITLHNPHCTQWNYVVYENGIPVQSATVSNPDTVISALPAGVYQVAIHMNNFLADSEEVILTDPAQVVAEFSSTEILSQVQFANESVGSTSYSWTFGDSNGSTDINPLHTYPGAGNYDVTLTASDANGCSSAVTHTVSIFSSMAYNGPDFLLIDPQADQANNAEQRNGIQMFNVYAADQALTISMDVPAEGNYAVNVFNMNGELISSSNQSVEKGNVVFQVHHEITISGIYLVSVHGGDQQFTKRIFIQK
jgi:PKD repeat protein